MYDGNIERCFETEMTFANDIMHQNKAGCTSTVANTELQFITIRNVKITRDAIVLFENVLVQTGLRIIFYHRMWIRLFETNRIQKKNEFTDVKLSKYPQICTLM